MAAPLYLLLLLFGIFLVKGDIHGIIRTCSGCKLNRLPELKTFLVGFGGAQSYEGIAIEYIHGHNPDLILFDGEKEIERIDLSKLHVHQIHQLLKEKGFQRTADEAQTDLKKQEL